MIPRGTLGLAGLLSVALLAPLAAQEPDTLPALPDREARPAQTGDTVPQQPAPVEPAYAPPRFLLTLTVGTLGFESIQSQPVLARRHGAAGEVLDTTVLSRSMDAGGGYQVTASGLVSLDATWAVRLAGGVGRTTLRPRYDGESALLADSAAALASQEADATLLVLETALRMRLPSSRRARPYLELGTTAIRWGIASAPAGAPDLSELAEGIGRVGGMAALGVDIPYSDRLSARIQATSRFFRTPIDPAPAGTAGPAGEGLSLTFAAPETTPYADRSRELLSGLRLEAGISVALGGTVEAPTDPAAPAASPSPPGR